MKFNFWKTVGVYKLINNATVRAVGKPALQLIVDAAIDQAKPALKNDVAQAIGALPSGHIADQVKQDAAAAAGAIVDNLQVTL